MHMDYKMAASVHSRYSCHKCWTCIFVKGSIHARISCCRLWSWSTEFKCTPSCSGWLHKLQEAHSPNKPSISPARVWPGFTVRYDNNAQHPWAFFRINVRKRESLNQPQPRMQPNAYINMTIVCRRGDKYGVQETPYNPVSPEISCFHGGHHSVSDCNVVQMRLTGGTADWLASLSLCNVRLLMDCCQFGRCGLVHQTTCPE